MSDKEKPADKPLEESKPQKPRKRVKNLNDLRSRKLIVEIEFDDYIEEYECEMLTYARYQEIGRTVNNPSPPMNGFDKAARPIFDYNNPGYLNQRAEAEDKRVFLRLAEFLKMDLPGDTLEERAQHIRDNFAPSSVLGLAQAMGKEYNEGETVAARAATFHQNGSGNA